MASKRDDKSVAVAAQYTGNTESCQVAVFSCRTPPATGVPSSASRSTSAGTGAGDQRQCKEASVPVNWAKLVLTKPELGSRMVERARCAGVPSAWVWPPTPSTVNRKLRAGLNRHGKNYVMAVPGDDTVDAGLPGSMRLGLPVPQLPLR